MIHSSWVWLAWVLRTRSGMATFNDAIAAETAPSAMQTTAVTRERFTGRRAVRTGRGMGWVSFRRNIRFVTEETTSVKREYSFCLWYRRSVPRITDERREARREQILAA